MLNGKRVTIQLIGVILFSFLWALFSPQQVGGSASHLILFGNSMEPDFVQGDLVFVKRSQVYNVGDIVAYYHPDIEQYVFHRIISIENGYISLQGDNNDWVDTYNPRVGEILGRYWFHIPKIGKAFEFFRTPVAFSLLFGVSLTLLFIGGVYGKEETLSEDTKTKPTNTNNLQTILSIAIGVFLVSIFLFIISFTKPKEIQIYQQYFVNQVARFSYSGSAPEGIYDQALVSDGQPIFPSVTCEVQFSYGYLLTGENLTNTDGTFSLTMHLTDNRSGLSRIQTLIEETTFSDNMLNIDQELDFCYISALIDEIEEKTGVASSSYTLELRPVIDISAETNNIPFDTRFSPVLAFEYDHMKFSLASSGDANSVLGPAETIIVEEQVSTPNHISFFGLQIPVLTMRIIALSFMGISLAVLVWGFIHVTQLQKDNPILVQQWMQGVEIFDISGEPTEFSGNRFYINDFSELARLAGIHKKVIFRLNAGLKGIYYFDYDGARYQFVEEEILDRAR